jgi:hypothetical protein
VATDIDFICDLVGAVDVVFDSCVVVDTGFDITVNVGFATTDFDDCRLLRGE